MIKKILIGALFFIVAAIGVKAVSYSRLTVDGKVSLLTNKLAQRLDLTEEQKVKVFQINRNRFQSHNHALEMGRDRVLIEKAHATWCDALKQALTQEQFSKLNIE